jgi:cytochrome P450
VDTVTRVDELKLAQIDLFDPAFPLDPFRIYDSARSVHPWIAKYQFGYFLLDQASMKAFLRDDRRCRTPNRDITRLWNAVGTPFERFTDHHMVALGGEQHRRIRDLVAPAFTPRAAAALRPYMRKVFEETLDALGDADTCDINDVSSMYPITVMCSIIGVAREDIPKFVHWLDGLEAAVGQDVRVLPMLNESLAGMLDYATGLVEERRRPGSHPDDLLQSLVNLAHEEDRLTDEELRLLLVLLLGAGFDTSKNQLNLIMKLFVDHPEEWRKVVADPLRAKVVIEEALRFLNPLGGLHRVTNEDIVYRDVLIPANTFLTFPVTYAGRDPAENDNPNVFDPDRPKMAHIAFGQGIHMCLGQFLARAILEEAVPIMARRLRHPRLNGECTYRSPLGIWGVRSLPIKFDKVTSPKLASFAHAREG